MSESLSAAVGQSAPADLISFLKAIPDGRDRRGVRHPQSSQKTLHRQLGRQFEAQRKIPFMATDHQKRHGRDTI